MSNYCSNSGYGVWYDTPVQNRPQCPICLRMRHGNQKRIYLSDMGELCGSCGVKIKNKAWYLNEMLRLFPDYTLTAEQINSPEGIIREILTSTRFPYVEGQHIYLDLYFQSGAYLDLVEQTN
jgi:hypothetical protein